MRRTSSCRVQLITRPVMNSVFGYQHVDVVVGRDHRGADVDLANLTHGSRFEFDEVADAQCSINQQNDSGDEAADQRLQSQTDTEAERACDHRERREVDADCTEAEHKSEREDRVVRQPVERVERARCVRSAP